MSIVHEYLPGHLEEALAHTGETDVHVTLSSGGLRITGTVATDLRRDAITAIASELAPNLRLHNDVTVLHVHEPDEHEELE